MKIVIPLILNFLVFMNFSYSQNTFQKAYGGQQNDAGVSIDITNDNGYIIGGYTESYGAGHKDILIMKFDEDDNIEWAKTYGGTNDEECRHIICTSDGGFILTGNTKSYGRGGKNAFLIKLDFAGNIQWAKVIGGTSDDLGRKVLETENGFIITGSTKSYGSGLFDILIANFDKNGNIQWAKAYGAGNNDGGHSIIQTDENFFAISVSTYSYGNAHQVACLKIDSSGNLIWFKTYGGYGTDGGRDIINAGNNNYLIVAHTNSYGAGNHDFFVLNINSNGNLNWSKAYGGPNEEYPYTIESTLSNEYLIGGYTKSFGFGNKDIYIIKIDESGNLKWSMTYGGTDDDGGEDYNSRHTILQTEDNKIIITDCTKSYGSGNGDICIIKTDSIGISEDCDQFTPNTIVTSPTIIVEDHNLIITNINNISAANFTTTNIILDETLICGCSLEINLGNDTSFCYGNSVILYPGSGFVNYLWQNGSSDSIFIASNTGYYWVEVTDTNGCMAIDSVYITVFMDYEISIGDDTSTICDGDYLFLDPGPGFESYLWQDGSSHQTFIADTAGIYWVEVTDTNSCSARDSILLIVRKIPENLLGNDTVICPGDIVTLNAGDGFVQYLWQDGSSDSVFIADSSGTYWVYVEDDIGCSGSDTVVLFPFIPPSLNLPDEIFICKGDSIVFNAGSGYLFYNWQDGSNDSVFIAYDEGLYWVNILTNCGFYSDSVLLSFYETAYLNLGNDTNICPGEIIELNPGDFNEYLWQDGSDNNLFIVTEPGIYWVKIFDGKCYASDTIFIDECSSLWVPNIFTPNDDNFNDYFYAIGSNITKFKMEIFNRWGRRLQTLNNINEKWDGKYKGNKCSQGVYYWIANFEISDKSGNKINKTLKGSVTLYR